MQIDQSILQWKWKRSHLCSRETEATILMNKVKLATQKTPICPIRIRAAFSDSFSSPPFFPFKYNRRDFVHRWTTVEPVNYFAHLFPGGRRIFLKESYAIRANASDQRRPRLNLNAGFSVLFQPDYSLSYFRLGFARRRPFVLITIHPASLHTYSRSPQPQPPTVFVYSDPEV